MAHALSNPYELVVDGITCKSSPAGLGWYLAFRDLEVLGEQRKAFESALFNQYEYEKIYFGGDKKELEGIRVFYKKPKESTL
jgi:hypothetical protein